MADTSPKTPKKGKGRALLGKAGRGFARVSSKVKSAARMATTKSTPTSPSPAEAPPQANPTPRRTSARVIRNKPTKLDQEWLDELSPEFFEAEFNDVEYVLNRTESLELEELQAFRDRRFQELHAVSRKFSTLVNNNAEQFVQELTRVSELQDQLEYATVLCKKERHKLARADKGVIKGLEVIRKTQQKQVLLEILHAAEEIHGLSKAQTKLTDLLHRDAFKEAIGLARASTQKLISYSERGFAVVEDLASDLQDTYMQIEEHLDRALATCCRSFSIEKYAEIVESYEMLGRPYAAHDRLGTYFVHAMQMSARDIARKHAGITKKSTADAGGDLTVMADAVSTGARQYKNICSKRLKPEHYEACLLEVCEAMCGLMVDFDSITAWHNVRPGQDGANGSDDNDDNASTSTDNDTDVKSDTPAGDVREEAHSDQGEDDQGEAAHHDDGPNGKALDTDAVERDADDAVATATANIVSDDGGEEASETGATDEAPLTAPEDTESAGGDGVVGDDEAAAATATTTTAGADEKSKRGSTSSDAASVSAALTDDSDPLESLVESAESHMPLPTTKQSATSNRLSPREYSHMKLEVHRRRLWLDVQRQIGMFLDQVNLAALKLPQYLQLLSHVKRLAAIGEDFSDQKGDILEKSIRENSLTYVHAFHRDMMLSFKAKMAKESWDAMQVIKGFNIYHLKEFSFLRRRKDAADKEEDDAPPVTLAAFAADRGMFQESRDAIADVDSQQISEDKDGADNGKAKSSKPPTRASSTASNAATSDVERTNSGTSNKSGGTTGTGKTLPPPPHCSFTAMMCVRYFGRYLNIMDVLKPVAPEAFQCMTELFSFFLETTWTFFGAVSEDKKKSKEEKRTTARLFSTDILTPAGRTAIEMLKTNKQPREGQENILFELSLEPLELSENCELGNPSRLNGLEYISTALESLKFLQTVLRSMRANFGRRLPVACHNFLKAFYGRFVDTITELRWLGYKNAVATMLRCDELTKACSSVKWDVKEIMSQHNPYVDKLVGELKIVKQRLEILGEQRVPEAVQVEVWTEIIHQINWAFLDGFAQAKKCTVEGRAFMQLDFRQYLSKVAPLSPVKPDSAIVDEWINAFYLPDAATLEEWLKSHSKKYHQAHLASLINVSSMKLGKKEKQRLGKVLEDLKTPSTARPPAPSRQSTQ
eukprot:m.78074 g.78074  ORF g.78074 m.78074 type:complete len:1170 (-) comp9192_c0_seq1:189-3698(-)